MSEIMSPEQISKHFTQFHIDSYDLLAFHSILDRFFVILYENRTNRLDSSTTRSTTAQESRTVTPISAHR